MQGNTFYCNNAESAGSGDIESFTITLNPQDSTVSIGTYSATRNGIVTGQEACAIGGLPLTMFYTFAAEAGVDGAAAQQYVTRASSSITGGTCTRTLASHNFSQPTCGVHIFLQDRP
jgi:hypothetical protein